MKKTLLLILSICALHGTVLSQVVYNESFEHVNPGVNYKIPLGWWQEQILPSVDVDNKFHCSNVATFPAILARTGNDMLGFNAKDITAGESSFLVSKRLDMRGGMPVTGASFSFWFYRDNVGMQASADRIQVFINDSAHISGGATGCVLLSEISTGASTINRSCGLLPAPATNNDWNQYSYNIPNSAPFNGSSVYILIVATSAAGYNMFIDDFSVNTYPLSQTYTSNSTSAEVFDQNVNTTAAGRPGERIIGCRLNIDGVVSPRTLANMEFNTNGSTNPLTDITNARLWFTGGTNSFDSTEAILLGTYNNPWMTNFMFLTTPNANYSGMPSFSGLEHGYNFFWITYNIAPGAVAGNLVDAEWIGFTIQGTPYTPATMTMAGSRVIWTNVTIPFYSSYCGGPNSNRTCWINKVILQGNLPAGQGINNTLNTIYGPAGPGCPPPFPRTCAWQTHPSDYELFQPVPGKTTSLTADGSTVYTLSVQVGSLSSTNYVGAWIDFNGDFTFSATEKIAQSGNLAGNSTYIKTFTVPNTADPGMALLRVREAINGTNMSPTGTNVYGEAEDYIITLIPECPSYPGWTTWMGISDDWNDPANWCPPVVPITANPAANVRIPGGPTGGTYDYYRPVIRDSILARTLKLRIEGSDTVFIDATTASSLAVLDSMKIQTATGALINNSTFIDSAQVSNGLLTRPPDSPFSSSQRSRTFISITQSELLAEGMRTGDLITGIRVHMQRKSNGNPYKNFTVKYFYTTNLQSIYGVGAAANIPLPTGTPVSPVTVYSGDLDPAATIALNDFGTILLPLSTPIVWNGGVNPLIIEMCYDNTGFPLTGTNDEVRFTQTTSLRRYMTIENLSGYNKAGCAMTPKDTLMSPSVGTLGSNQLTVAAIDAPDIIAGQMTSTGMQVLSVAGNVVTLSGPLPMNINGNVIFYNSNVTSGIYRPNLTFEFSRPYQRFPISVAGHWENNGTFTPAFSIVTMNGTVANQKISGASPTTFFDLKINNINHVQLTSDATVTDSLMLAQGRLKLNNKLITLTNPGSGMLSRTTGSIQSEMDAIASNVAPFGRLRWQMGNAPGIRVIPFMSMNGDYLPLDYVIDSGTHDVTFATYRTLQNNTNLPLPEVTNIFGMNNAAGGSGYGSAGWAMADRYFMINNTTAAGAQADITFRYATTEQAQGGNANMRAQRWINATDVWEFPFQPLQAFTPGTPNSILLPDYTGFANSTWWTITGNSSPLPVTLLDFYAKTLESKVRLHWTTASEIDNSHFDVERTLDNSSFEFIGRVKSQGTSNNLQEYDLWDNYPLMGTQYYYLRQYDYDGKLTSYGPVSATFSKDQFDIITTTVSPSENGLSVVFNYNSKQPYSYRIMDMTGRIIIAKDKNPAVEGINVIDINVSLAKGAYYIVLQNNEKVVSRKFFY